MSTLFWKVLFGGAAAAISFVLAQTDVPLDPLPKVVLGAILAVLAILNPNTVQTGARGLR